MTDDAAIPKRRSIRIPSFDYTRCGTYFVTLCAFRRQTVFGEIVDGKMCPCPLGRLVLAQWDMLPSRFRHVELGPRVVMPNHLHGVIAFADDAGTASRAPTEERFGRPVAGSLPTMIRSFKSGVAREARRLRVSVGEHVWQRGYFEHIVRNERALWRIAGYILTNPERWCEDRENPGRSRVDEFDHWLTSHQGRRGDLSCSGGEHE